MPERPFVHLHCHTHYSLLDGANRIPELVAHVKSLGMNAVRHHRPRQPVRRDRVLPRVQGRPASTRSSATRPTSPPASAPSARPSAAATPASTSRCSPRTRPGFKNLIKMASVAFLEGYYYVPRIDKELLEAHSEGLICLSRLRVRASSASSSSRTRCDEADEAGRLVRTRSSARTSTSRSRTTAWTSRSCCADGAIDIANQLGLPLVATCDAHYLRRTTPPPTTCCCASTPASCATTRTACATAATSSTSAPPEEMYGLFPGHADAVAAQPGDRRRRATSSSTSRSGTSPSSRRRRGKTPDEYLRELCEAGLTERYGDNPPEAVADAARARAGHHLPDGLRQLLPHRLGLRALRPRERHPGTRPRLGVRRARQLRPEAQPRRPLEYDLLFERFLDPNRTEAPDIDIDFCQDRREEVIAVRQARSTARTASPRSRTFGTLAAKAALKDVGRVLDVPLERVNRLTKHGARRCSTSRSTTPLEQSRRTSSASTTTTREVRELIDIARKLEGTNRNAGTHAAGVVIANGPLTDYVPRAARRPQGRRRRAAATARRSSPRSGSWATSRRSAC